MKLRHSFETADVSKYMWKQMRAVGRKYKEDNLRQLNIKVASVIAALRYPDFKMEYNNKVYTIIIPTDDLRWDHIALYVTEKRYEVRIPTGFLRTDNTREVREYVERV